MTPVSRHGVPPLHIPHMGGDVRQRDAVHHAVQGKGGIRAPRPAQRVHAPESME